MPVRSLIVLLLIALTNQISFTQYSQKIRGLSVVAPPHPPDPLWAEKICESGAEWVALIPYGFCRKGSYKVLFNLEHQWWGEKAEGISEMARQAHAQGLKVMLKPQIWIHDKWTGDLLPESSSEREEWENSYRQFARFYADLAQRINADMFCIGTELDKAINAHPSFWKKLISECRIEYTGKITYAANWDSYQNVGIWDACDFIGINAYFPLSDSKIPSVSEVKKSWDKIWKELEPLSLKTGTKILFTEIGYCSQTFCAARPWAGPEEFPDGSFSAEAQTNCIRGFLEFFSDNQRFAGAFLWNWHVGATKESAREFSPQDKPAMQTLKSWFGSR